MHFDLTAAGNARVPGKVAASFLFKSSLPNSQLKAVRKIISIVVSPPCRHLKALHGLAADACPCGIDGKRDRRTARPLIPCVGIALLPSNNSMGNILFFFLVVELYQHGLL
jgi:hypothetical protein